MVLVTDFEGPEGFGGHAWDQLFDGGALGFQSSDGIEELLGGLDFDGLEGGVG